MNITGLTLAQSAAPVQTATLTTSPIGPHSVQEPIDSVSKADRRDVIDANKPTSTPAPSSLSPEDAARMVEQLNKTFMPINDDMQFSLDQESGKMVFSVKDGKTGEVIRQIPQEVLLKISKNLSDYLQRVQTDLKQTGGQSLPAGLITDTTA